MKNNLNESKSREKFKITMENGNIYISVQLVKLISIVGLAALGIVYGYKKKFPDKKSPSSVLVEYQKTITLDHIEKVISVLEWLDLPESQKDKKAGDDITILDIEEFNDKNGNNEDDKKEGEHIDRFFVVQESESDTLGRVELLSKTKKTRGDFFSKSFQMGKKPLPDSYKNRIANVIPAKVVKTFK